MNRILEMREKRGQIWDRAKAFLKEHQDENGMLSAEDAAEYERMEQEVVELGRVIDREERAAQMERELNAPVAAPLASRPEARPSAINNLKIRNIRFIDDSRDHVINAGENCKVVFEIMNEGNRTAFNVVPVVAEVTGMKHVYISPSVMIEQIAPREGVKYTASISAGERIKTGEVIFRIAVADENGEEYDWQEFSLPTQR